jgi:hypothetical protein
MAFTHSWRMGIEPQALCSDLPNPPLCLALSTSKCCSFLSVSANLDDLRRQDTEEREYFKGQIEELKEKCQDKQERVNDERFKFMEFKKEIALNSVNSRSGKPIPAKVLTNPKSFQRILSTQPDALWIV